jgi:hypothetical protein
MLDTLIEKISKCFIKYVFITLFFLTIKQNLYGQVNFTVSNLEKGFDKFAPDTQKTASIKGLTGIAKYDTIILEKYQEKLLYHMDHEMSAFRLQYYSSITIFILVVVIVSSGLYLSYRQFILSERLLSQQVKLNQQTIEKGDNQPLITNSSLELSKDGVKINSAVIGLIILVISLVFFFLYLKYVYNIDSIIN